jgi:hypothetical protein
MLGILVTLTFIFDKIEMGPSEHYFIHSFLLALFINSDYFLLALFINPDSFLLALFINSDYFHFSFSHLQFQYL